jgi:hypothetical protein
VAFDDLWAVLRLERSRRSSLSSMTQTRRSARAVDGGNARPSPRTCGTGHGSMLRDRAPKLAGRGIMIGEDKRTRKQFGGFNAQSHKNAAKAAVFAEQMWPIMAKLEALSANKAALVLNERGVPSAAGRRWGANQVLRVRRRLARLAER